jgi:MFS transporter, DHA1 family, tetracycline resistance protein
LVGPNLSALVAESAGNRSRGEALGFQQSAGAAARVIGPLCAGLLFDRGVSLPYLVGAALVALGLGASFFNMS